MTMLSTTVSPGFWAATGMIAAVVLSSTTGEVLTASAMKSIGDLDEIRAQSGLKGAIRAVVTCPRFYAGVVFLNENVDRRRWTAAALVCIGVYFLAH